MPRPGVRLPADEPDAGPGAIPSSRRISASGRDRSRGWLGRLKSWNMCRRIDSGAAPAVPQFSLPTRIAGLALQAHDQQRLLEARVEAGQVRDVGAVLTIGVDDEPLETAPLHPLAQPLEPGRVQSRRDLRHLCRASRNRADPAWPIEPAVSSVAAHWIVVMSAARASTRYRASASTLMPRPDLAVGPGDPDLRAVVRRPSPKWTGPSCPLTWPPPIVISRSLRPAAGSDLDPRRRSRRDWARPG